MSLDFNKDSYKTICFALLEGFKEKKKVQF